MFGLSLGLHVQPYCVDYSRTSSTGSSESLRVANAISDKLAQFQVALTHAWNKTDSPKVEPEYRELHVIRKNF